jgi:hypothetical protein
MRSRPTAATPVTLAPEQTPESSPDDTATWHTLRHKRIGLYSLLPHAGARLRERLLALCPEITVEHNRDTVSTASLRNLARNADYLIVDTWHAAHSATKAIDDVRPRSEQLFPASGGVMSLLVALQVRLQSGT